MDFGYESTAIYSNTPIDNRYLSLVAEFYELSRNQAENFAKEVIDWLLRACPEKQFVSTFRSDNYRIISHKKILSRLSDSSSSFLDLICHFDSYYKSEVIKNKNTMGEYTRSIEHGTLANNAMMSNPFAISVDYQPFWDSILDAKSTSNEQLKSKIISLFHEKGRICKQHFLGSDISAKIKVKPYSNNNTLHYGAVRISFSAFCIKNNLTNIAQDLSIFAEQLSVHYRNINVRVMLQPCCIMKSSPHALYFGSDGSVDDSHLDKNYTEKEWYPSYYLPGVEWLNILSPLARKQLDYLSGEASVPEGICIKELPCGSVIVKADVPIEEYDIDHALMLKQLLYPALYPGRKIIPLKLLCGDPNWATHPIPYIRKEWEIVPVFEDEVDIVSEYLVFSYSEPRKEDAQRKYSAPETNN